jgi:hypothetical protein
MGFKARKAILFKVAAILSGIMVARSTFAFRSTNVAMQVFLLALSLVASSQSLMRNFSSTMFGRS